MSKKYTDADAVKKYLLTTIDASFDTQIDAWIDAASRMIDGYCGLTVYDDAASTYTFNGTGEDFLIINSVYDVSEVKVDDVVVTPYLYPANSARKYHLELADGCFTTGRQNVSVTGIFARCKTLPADVKLACTILVGVQVRANKDQSDNVLQEHIGDYRIMYKTDDQRSDIKRAFTMLDMYRPLAL